MHGHMNVILCQNSVTGENVLHNSVNFINGFFPPYCDDFVFVTCKKSFNYSSFGMPSFLTGKDTR
jgi:hypothetical protein